MKPLIISSGQFCLGFGASCCVMIIWIVSLVPGGGFSKTYTREIVSYKAPVYYTHLTNPTMHLPIPTMHHFVTEMCTHVQISVTKWCVVGCGIGALCFRNRSIYVDLLGCCNQLFMVCCRSERQFTLNMCAEGRNREKIKGMEHGCIF